MRVLFKLIISIIIFFLGSLIMTMLRVIQGPNNAGYIIFFASIAAIIAVIKYKPKTNNEELYKLEKIDEDIK